MNLATEHAAAASGATITVPAQGGVTHGNQSLTLDKQVRFVGEPGATLGDVTIAVGAGQIELSNLTVGTVTIGSYTSSAPGESFPTAAHDITLNGLNGTRWAIRWARNIKVLGGDWGDVSHRCEIAPIQPWDGNNVPTNILVDGGYYHDFGPSTPSLHTEGILIYGANGVTVRNAQFARCGGTGDIGLFFVDAPGVSAADFIALCNIRIENCVMSEFFSSDRNLDAYFNAQISNSPPIPGLADPRRTNNHFRKLTFQSNNPPLEYSGINWFPRAVPGGTPRVVAAPSGWATTPDPRSNAPQRATALRVLGRR